MGYLLITETRTRGKAFSFYPRDAMPERYWLYGPFTVQDWHFVTKQLYGLSIRAISNDLNHWVTLKVIRLSVCLSVTSQCSVKTTGRTDRTGFWYEGFPRHILHCHTVLQGCSLPLELCPNLWTLTSPRMSIEALTCCELNSTKAGD